VAALEIMVATTAIRTLIRDDKIHQLYGAMQAGQERVGMQTMNQSLARLVERRAISREAARTTSSSRDELDAMLDRRCGRAPAASPRPLRPSPAVP
jgi:twitching motility protein PilT